MSKLDTLLEDLKSDNPKVRRKACEKLANLEDRAAIPALSKLYHEIDDDEKVQVAAEKALAHFAALEARETGKAGGGRIWRLLTILFSLSLMILIILNILLRLGGAEPIPDPTPRDVLLAAYQNDHLLPALDNMNILKAEWEAGAGNLPCNEEGLTPLADATLSRIDSYTYPDVTFVDTLNQAIGGLRAARTDWKFACDTNKGSANQATNALNALAHIEGQLQAVTEALSIAQQSPAPTNPPPTTGPIPDTPVPSATEGPSPTSLPPTLPVETLSPTPSPLPPTLISGLEKVITDATFSVDTLIRDRWEASRNGQRSSFGCAINPIPEDYTLPEGTAYPPELEITVDAINQALALARESSDLYVSNCNNQTLNDGVIDQGIGLAQQAQELLTSAQEIINGY